MVIENWNTLQERAAQRKIELQASYQLQRFLASVSILLLFLLIKKIIINSNLILTLLKIQVNVYTLHKCA